MQTVSFEKPFLQAIARCRYSVYFALICLLVWRAYNANATLSSGLVYFVIAPALIQTYLTHKSAIAKWLMLALHVFEFSACLFMLMLNGLPFGALLAMVCVFLASNVALWGFVILPGLAIGGCVAILLWTYWDSGSIELSALLAHQNLLLSSDVWVDSTAQFLAFVAILFFCRLAHIQAQRLLFGRRTLQQEKRVLEKYLPRDLPQHLACNSAGSVVQSWQTVAFVDLSGFTRAATELPPETLCCIVNDFLRTINTQVDAHGGHVSKFLGDGVLCVFPAVQVDLRQEMAANAVACFADLRQLMSGLNAAWKQAGYLYCLDATCGVASGYCAVGSWGDEQRRDYTVIGEPVNLASRLQSQAQQYGGLLLDRVTAELVGGGEHMAEHHTLQLKGLQETSAFVPLPA